jgi:hypothetical protein
MILRHFPSISLSLNAAQNLLFSIDTSHLPTSATVHVCGLPVVKGENTLGVRKDRTNLVAVQVWLKGERWREWACEQEPVVAVELDLVLGALEQERMLEAG